MKVMEIMMEKYEGSSFVTQLKARFLLFVYAAMIAAIIFIIAYTTYLQSNNPVLNYSVDLRLLCITTGTLLLIIGCTVLLLRGRFSWAAHSSVISLFAAIWAVMIIDRSEVVSRLDTIVLVLAVLSSTPLFTSRRRIAVLLYSGVNLAAFYAFMFYFRGELNLSASVFPAFLADNTVAFLFMGFISYNFFSINNRALEQLGHSNSKLERAYKEIQAAMEELEATNEEFEAQNEELIRSEDELNQSQAVLESFVNALPEPSFLIDDRKRFLVVNSSLLGRLGLKRNDVIGKTIFEFTGEAIAQNRLEHIDTCFKDSQPAIFEESIGERHYMNYVYPVLDNGGRVFSVAVFSLDITQRKSAEARLLREKLFTSTMLETLPGIFFMLDREGMFIRWKGLGKKETTFGYRTEEIMSMNALDLADESERGFLSKKMEEVFSEGYASAEIAVKSKDGKKTYYQLSGSRMKLGNDMYLIGIGTEITERKKAEEERERTRMQLLQAQKMEAVGTLAGGIAHDFNNMLGGIMGSINMIEILLNKDNHPQKETIARYVETALEASQRASEMTRQMLTLSRKSELKLAPVDINMAMKHVQKLCVSSFPKSVELDFEIGDEPLRILADPVQIEQVLLNLCVNASHAMTIMRPGDRRQGGTIGVMAESIRCDGNSCPMHPNVNPNDIFIRIRVSDTGVGMDEDVRRNIFDPFFTTKESGEGTGLGLAITYSIVKQHGGFIDVVSDPGKGSTFTVCLPALAREVAHDGEKTERACIVPGGGRVLVIDDEATMLRVSEGMLNHCGYSVITAGTRDNAIDIYQRENERIDGVLMDFSMPGTSGLEIYDLFREINGSVKVLLCSGLIEGVDLQKARDRGIRGFIQKPYSVEDLSAKMKEILG